MILEQLITWIKKIFMSCQSLASEEKTDQTVKGIARTGLDE
jgi:hypothetical protein